MTDPTADWPPMPDGAPFLVPVPPKAIGIDELTRMGSRLHGVEARLRTTAEALRAATTWAAPMRDAPKSARPAWFDAARAVLAQLEQEGLA